jgi:hypothetical protein
MLSITNRRLKLGIIYTYILIFIQILFALTFLIDFMADNYDVKKDIIYQILYAYVYVSILILIRKLVIENTEISKYLLWIIRLEIFKAISSIMVALHIYQAKILVPFIGFILIVFYFLLIVNMLSKKYNHKIEILKLRPYVIAVIIGFVIALISGVYAEYNRGFEIYGIIYLVLAIPYIFIIRYFNKMKIEIE